VYASGDCYTGEWVKDVAAGFGKMLCGGGDAYEGQWAGGRRDGKGTCTYAHGDRYQVRFLARWSRTPRNPIRSLRTTV
jgi:hypothetical protein